RQRQMCIRDRVYRELRRMEGIKVYPSEANFILFKSLLLPAEQLHIRLVEEGVLIRDFSHIVPQCLRVSIGKPWENDAFLEALEKVLKTLDK
ncbi:MAG: aminotransferase class I/II-fold pyridoxal phosphate-dependent enzyme, partial [Aquificaceae bacterium]|nr:aminotransferase class I/II-fold pyridoxal phosphate-dependent enzyme [Aquificaceae bacterium]